MGSIRLLLVVGVTPPVFIARGMWRLLKIVSLITKYRFNIDDANFYIFTMDCQIIQY